MSHECDDCGQTFDTLTRLRLHDCSSADEAKKTTLDSSTAEDVTPSEWADRRPETVAVDPLDGFFDESTDGEVDSLPQAMATY